MDAANADLQNALAALVRESVDAAMYWAACKENIASGLIGRVPEDEVRAWTRYELNLIASAIENGGVPPKKPVMCSGVDLFHALEGHPALAPALAAESQVYMVGIIYDRIREQYKACPDQLEAVTDLYIKAVTPYVMVNANAFLARIEEGIAMLGREGQLRPASSPAETCGQDGEQQPALFADAGLTGREEMVVRLVTEGKTNGEIAAALGITQNTVKNHIRHILEKTGLENRVQLGVHAAQISKDNEKAQPKFL